MSKVNINIETITNDEYKSITTLTVINYALYSKVFGDCVIGTTQDKICYLAFTNDKQTAVNEIQDLWPNASLVEDQAKIHTKVAHLFTDSEKLDSRVRLLLKGTPFQIKVWKALVSIPFGTKVSYESIAEKIGNIKAVRAVASSIARNNISYIIPCHRVIRKSGELHKYRWGANTKKAILEWEEGFVISRP